MSFKRIFKTNRKILLVMQIKKVVLTQIIHFVLLTKSFIIKFIQYCLYFRLYNFIHTIYSCTNSLWNVCEKVVDVEIDDRYLIRSYYWITKNYRNYVFRSCYIFIGCAKSLRFICCKRCVSKSNSINKPIGL